MSIAIAVVGAFAVTSALLLAASQAQAAASQDLTLAVTPSTLQLRAEGEAQALIIATNPTTDAVRDLRLSWFTDAGVTITVTPPLSGELAPQGMFTWDVRVSQQPNKPVSGTVYFRVDYDWPVKDGSTPRTAMATLKITPRKPEAVEQVAIVRTESGLTNLLAGKEGVVNVVVTNTAEITITVMDVKVTAPARVTPTVSDPHTAVAIGPRETHVFPVHVEADKRVDSGKHLLVFEIPLEWTRAGQRVTSNIVTSRQITLGVVGESEILTLLAVPTLFILPGFLTVVVFASCWHRLWPKGDSPPDVKTPEGLVFAISLSLVMAWAYPWLTGLRGESRDYVFKPYGLDDVLWVWFLSLVAGVLIYALVAFVWRVVQRVQQERARREQERARRESAAKEFKETEKPEDLLRTLANRDELLSFDLVQVTISQTEIFAAYLLDREALRAQKPTAWVTGGVIVNLPAAIGPEAQTFKDLVDQPGITAKEIWARLEKLKTAHQIDGKPLVTVAWAEGNLPSVMNMPAKQVVKSGLPQKIVQAVDV